MPGPVHRRTRTAVAATRRLTGQSTIWAAAQPWTMRGAVSERLAIAGSGAIACGLAATAARHGPVSLLARSETSAERARATVEQTLCGRLERRGRPRARADRHRAEALADASFVVEAVVEDHDAKAELLGELDAHASTSTRSSPRTTSSLSIERLAAGERAPRALRRSARVQPGHEDEARRAGLPRERQRGHARRARWRCARRFEQDRRSRCPTCPASSSTGCCSPTCSAPCACSRRPGMAPADVDTCMTPRRRPPDGAAGAARPRRPRRRQCDRRDDRRAGARARRAS